MPLNIPFDNSYAALPDAFFTAQNPTPVKAPSLIAFNTDLANLLGIKAGEQDELAQTFAGNSVPDGAAPLAQLYSGHQFGTYNPQLGDGRAVLLGEVIGKDGQRRDIQLKGSGPTPYSRNGDGRAWLGPVLREYVVSEAMHALGIPTTRALAAVQTGEPVFREAAFPGAVLTRVASSHLRVGTFQVFAHRGQIDDLKTLTNYAIQRHYPDATSPMDLLRAVCAAQATLIPAWMSVGFIHGVMNTDNCAIGGETIDYGPCAFMDAYSESRVFSSIDRGARYAFANQPDIAVWNMAQLATSLLQIIEDKEAAVEEATEIVHAMPKQLETAWLQRFGAKLGIAAATPADQPMIEGFLAMMEKDGADFTNTFAALQNDSAQDQFTDRAAYKAWAVSWRARISQEKDPKAIMAKANPVVIARNHRIEEMIQAAVAGDFAPFERLNAALATPYTTTDTDLHRAPLAAEIVPATFCGT
jgi:uncharacterized protein YdiU (UPF0061 family)